MGDTMVLVTACHSSSPREGIDFLPLTVDYREYTYASGRIPGGFFKREGKATEKETLTSRLIDRPIRPLFPAGWALRDAGHRVRAVGRHRKRLATCSRSPAPSRRWRCRRCRSRRPIAGVRVGLVDGQFIVNPTFPQRKQSRLDLVVAGSKDGIVMVEAGAKEVTEEEAVHGARDRARRHQASSVDDDRRARQGSRPHQAGRSPRSRSTPRSRPTIEAKALGAAHRCDAHQGQARELRHGRARSRRK